MTLHLGTIAISIGGSLTLSFAGVLSFWQWWLKKKISARVDEETQKNLAEFHQSLDKEQRRFQNELDKKLEDHKSMLQRASSEAQFDYQRRIQDFNFYASRKHETYPEVYKKILEAESNLLQIYGVKYYPDFNQWSANEIEQNLSESRVPQVQITSIIQIWNANKQKAIQELTNLYNRIEKNRAYDSFFLAKNTWLLSSLYLSENANKLCEVLFQNLASYMALIQYPSSNGSHQRQQFEQVIKNQMDKISTLFKKELSAGYYNEESPPEERQ
ncbi:MAG: hypothetical protein C7B46_20385 [Sulfobacillus benefaciens]|uniref:Uncharacterized protein n=1 Tax=Sulfobacillus benefaciens TaxID=453960 RepID=A0A2T2WUV5_9FIRM|nr:MAG: hypothetical protein C7B46_20385 [Sulfobacillus benefaciens]